MNSIKVVKIVEANEHPKANKLKVCKVTDGKETFQVVCGAANVRLNMHTIYASVGSTLPSGTNIQKADLRGVESYGMLCSAKDLSVSQEGGIIDLPETIALATAFEKIPTDLLSSTPWHLFREVDGLWENTNSGEIKVVRTGDEFKPSKDYKLLSKTYFQNNQYYYRHYN
ncbi:MAG: hypothetical protein JNM93_07320 [Bacteriovoracaceae bacterium]|nr:hypothetical protein [Bacteriovoracaceae bacterium]